MNIDKLKKIGVSALAGSLVSVAAHAAEFSVSGSAGLYVDQQDEDVASTWAMSDSLKFNASGTTDNGIDIGVYFELDGVAEASGDGAWDDHSLSIGTAEMGTLKFWGHGGSSVMSQFDDISPKAYEEVSDIGTINGVTADNVIGGVGNNNMFEYTSPSFAGVTLKAAYNTASSATEFGKYNDMGVMIQPEMVEGLTLYYATGEKQTSAAGQTTDVDTMAVKYAYGPVTVSYQESNSDVSGTLDDAETTHYAVAYTVSDDLTISYGSREYDVDTSDDAAGNKVQEDTGFAVSYTMGGVSISAQKNNHDNVGGTAANDGSSTSVGISFAF